MALDDKVLDNYFNKTKKAVVYPKKLTNSDSSIIVSNTDNAQIPKRFRVFDDPLNTNQSLELEADENPGQSSDKLRTFPRTNLGQSSDKPKTDQIHKTQSSDKPKTELRTVPRTNLGQSSDKSHSNSTFSSLVGLQRKIVLFIYENCKLGENKITRPLAIEHLAKHCQTTELSAQKTIQRLEKKQILYRAEFKTGRSGWTKYGFYESIFHELIHNETYEKFTLKLGQSSDKLKTELRTESRTSFPSSSSVIYNKNTTTSELQENDSEALLPTEWDEVEIMPLAEISFTKHHLKQIANQNKISARLVQESINAFAFDLKENSKGKVLKTSPLNYFMGILRSGVPYAPPSNYESPESRAMKIYLEKKKEVEQKQKNIEEELFNFEFDDWKKTLTNDQINEILPDDIKNSNLTAPKTSYLRTHYRNEIWPTMRQEIIKNL